MEINVLDASKYFKGLLLLIRKDHKVTDIEYNLMARIGKQLGFEKEFCDNAVQEILRNRFIEDSPPEFSSRELAAMFIRDGLAVGFCDHEIDRKEVKWLKAVALKNMLDIAWFDSEMATARTRAVDADHLEVNNITVTTLV